MKYMSDIVFRNTSYAFFTEIRHGQIRLKGKLDSGAPISVFNLSALSLYLGADESVLRQQIVNSNTPASAFKGYNGLASRLYLCAIHNVMIDQFNFNVFYVGVSLDYPIDRDGRPITKILIGMDLLNSCDGTIHHGGNIELTVKSMEFQKKRMLEAFHATTSDHILVIDELKEQ